MVWQFSGVYTALVTPFRKDGEIDWAALDRLVDRQVAAGVDGIVVLGTTGERPTVSDAEADALLRRIRDRVREHLAVIAGVSSNDTAHAVSQAKAARAAGADGLLVTCPYYNKPTQPGLTAHFHAVAEAVPLPQILYNIVGRTGVNLAPTTIAELGGLPNIAGIKEANPDMGHVMSVLASAPDGFSMLSGNDDMTLPMMALGGRGVISTLVEPAAGAV